MTKIDLTPIVQALISLLATIITIKVIPYIKSKTSENTISIINMAAGIAVGAAEQIYNHGDNKRKVDFAVKYVLDYLSNDGFEVDIHTVKAAVEKEVNALKDNKKEKTKETINDDIPPLEEWDLDTIKDFCELNEIACSGCETKEDYIKAIVNRTL